MSMLCAIAATFAAAFFLYDPILSFYVSSPREVGELIFFAGTALIGAKCTADLTRPLAKPRDAMADPLQRHRAKQLNR